MKPKSAKQKGKNFERDIAKALGKAFNCKDTRRTPCSGAIDTFPGDICKLPKEIDDFIIECKKQERMNLWDWLAQAEREAGRKTPVLIFSRNRSKTYAVMEFNDWLNILLEARKINDYL